MFLALLGAETGALPVGTAALLPQEIQLLPYGLILTTPEGCWPRETQHSHCTGDAAQCTLLLPKPGITVLLLRAE